MSPSMCPISRTTLSAVRLRTDTGPSAGMDRTATPCVVLTWAITGRRAVCSGRSVTHTARCQPRSRSIRRPAEINSVKSVGGWTSRSETNSSRHRTPGSCSGSRSAISGSRLSVSSEAAPGDASRPTTISGRCEVPGKLAASVSTVPMRVSYPHGHPGRASSDRPPTRSAHRDEELAEVLAVQHAEERLRRVLQAADDVFLVLQRPVARPVRRISEDFTHQVGDELGLLREELHAGLPARGQLHLLGVSRRAISRRTGHGLPGELATVKYAISPVTRTTAV